MIENRPSPSVAPLLIDAADLGRLLSLSRATIWRMESAGKLPKPVRIGGSTRWRRSDIESWIELGCPDRRDFEQFTNGNGRPRG